jgi:hypothetical protein
VKDDNVVKVDSKNFKASPINPEEVPYLNNNSDGIQDILKKIEKNVIKIQDRLLEGNENNITTVNFGEKNTNTDN